MPTPVEDGREYNIFEMEEANYEEY